MPDLARLGTTVKQMKNEDLARSLAKETRQSHAEARDQIDELVHRILRSLRAGKPVTLPGMGKLVTTKRNKRTK